MEAQNFWGDQEAAQKVIDQVKELKGWVIPCDELKTQFDTLAELFPEAIELGDNELIEGLVKELEEIEKKLSALEVKRMLSGELDNKNCYLSINAGAGGTEACDWVLMLSRMYQRWAEKRGWKVELIDSVAGDVAGLKSVSFKFIGACAFGYAKAEKGVHRLVRISPFDSGARRHTSFASVDVTPEVSDDIAIEIKPEDVRVDTFRSSGSGGQHVNTTDSAVRMTHIPTGIVASCQAERSQIQNREKCLNMLKSKLYEKQVLEREEHLKKMEGEKLEIAWGSQIRNYTFQPYSLVKDTRTKEETGNVTAVMDGEIDLFVNAFLKKFG